MDTNPGSQGSSDAESKISNLDVGSQAKLRKPPKISLIVIVTPIDILAFIQKLKGDHNDPSIKFQSTKTGLEIFATRKAQFKKILENLQQKAQINLFHHSLPSNKLKHVILKGLPNLEIEKIGIDLPSKVTNLPEWSK